MFSNTTASRLKPWLRALLLLSLLTLSACVSSRDPASIPHGNPPASGTGRGDLPQGLSARLPYPDFPADTAVAARGPAASEAVSIGGSQYVSAAGSQNYPGKGTETSYSLVSSGSCAWAAYETDAMGGARPSSITINAGPAYLTQNSSENLALLYWVALADYRLGKWQWQGPFSTSTTLALDTQIFSQRYYSNAGKLHLAVFTLGSAQLKAGVKINSIAIQPSGYEEMLARISNSANFAAAAQQPQGADGDFNFIVIGDDRDGEANYVAMLQQMRAYNPAFIVNTGDIVPHGYLAEIERYAGLLDTYDIPILSIVGNHDIISGPANYAKYFGSPEWTFEYGGIRIVGLDNANGKFSDADLAYAHDNLTKEKLCFAAFHRPPLVERWKVHGMLTDDKGSNMTPMLATIKASGAAGVFLGHIHIYDEMDIDGIPWIISGGGGSPLAESYGFGTVEFGFVVVHVHDGAWTFQWVKKTDA